jgi:rhodanese-related sulfurtransferase
MSIRSISPEQLKSLVQQGESIELIDVRTPVEFREVHLQQARNVPLDQLNPRALMEARNGHGEQPLYIICRSGARGQKACEQFQAAGFENVLNVEGGTAACEQAGLSVVRGKKAISLERQVRIAAGLLALTGSLLALFVNVNFAWLSAFIGAGLTFAGITDTCGMAMMLAKMPWNQVRDGSGASCST